MKAWLVRVVQRYLMYSGLFAHVVLGLVFVAVLALGPRATLQHAGSAAKAVYAGSKPVVQWLAVASGRSSAPVALQPAPDAFTYTADAAALPAGFGYGRTLRVGPGQEFALPSAAAAVAKAGDIVEIDAGNYHGDSVIWRAADLVIRGRGGVARLDLSGHRLEQDKAIWIIRGDNVLVEHIEFTGARSGDLNGAGIRAEGPRLHVRHCYFHDNEAGILAGEMSGARYLVEHSEFARNGHPGGQSHQLYVGRIAELTVRYSYFHDTLVGSAVKSRAALSRVMFNRIVDGRDGQSNYAIDLSSGGLAFVVGNVAQQNQQTGNYTLISYAPEGQSWPLRGAYIVHNTIVNDRHSGRFIKNHDDIPINVYNNLLIGHGLAVEGAAQLAGNTVMAGDRPDDDSLGGIAGSSSNRFIEALEITDRAGLDYRLVATSRALDTAVALPATVPAEAHATLEYRHPLGYMKRTVRGAGPDPGAYEVAP